MIFRLFFGDVRTEIVCLYARWCRPGTKWCGKQSHALRLVEFFQVRFGCHVPKAGPLVSPQHVSKDLDSVASATVI